MSRARQQRAAAGHAPVTPEMLGWEPHATSGAALNAKTAHDFPFQPPTYQGPTGGGGSSGPTDDGSSDPDLGGEQGGQGDGDDGDDTPGAVAAGAFVTAAVFGLAGLALGFVFSPNIAQLLGGGRRR